MIKKEVQVNVLNKSIVKFTLNIVFKVAMKTIIFFSTVISYLSFYSE